MMTEQDHCSGCPQEHNCSRVYETLGRGEGDSVLGRVFLAFLLPIFVFIFSVLFVQRITEKFIDNNRLSIMVNFLFAGGGSFIFILVVRFFRFREIKSCDRRSKR